MVALELQGSPRGEKGMRRAGFSDYGTKCGSNLDGDTRSASGQLPCIQVVSKHDSTVWHR